MAITAEQFVFQLSAKVSGFEDEVNGAAAVFNRATAKIEQGFGRMDRRIEESTRSARINMKSLIAAAAGALGAREVMAYADAWVRARNALTTARVPAQQQAAVLERLFEQSQRYSTELNAQVELFGNVTRAASGLTDSQEDLFRFTEAVAASLKADGQSASQAAGPLLQLGQALRSPIIQAEEFNSLIDGAPSLLEAAAKGIGKYRGDLSALIRDAKSGNLSSRAFFEGILAGSNELQSRVGQSADTFESAFQRIENALTKYIGSTDDGLSASQRLIAGLNAFADDFDNLADSALKLASIVSGALVGRAIGGLAVQIPLAIVAVRLLRLASIGAAQGASFLAANFGGATTAIAGATVASRAFRIAALGFFAGPIGLLVGGLATSMISLDSVLGRATDSMEGLDEEMDRLGLSSRRAAAGVKATDDALAALTAGQTARRLRQIDDELNAILAKDGTALGDIGKLIGLPGGRAQIEQVIDGVDTLRGSLADMFRSSADLAALDEVRRLALELQNADAQAQDVIDRMDELATLEVSSETDKLIQSLEAAARRVLSLTALQRRYNEEAERGAAALSDMDIFRAADKASMANLRDATARGQAVIDERSRRAALDPSEREIEDRMQQISQEIAKAGQSAADAIEGAGAVLSKAAIRAQAERELRSERQESAAQRGLLDLIASVESGRDGYNATLDNGRWTGGPRDLVRMTIDEVLQLQSTMRTPENRQLYGDGKGSSALGRYQIVGSTLAGLKRELGLSGSELYDVDMQDRLAQQLIRRRGNDPAALRSEWAGLKGISDDRIRTAYGETAHSLPRDDEAVTAAIEKRREMKAAVDDLLASVSAETKETLLQTSLIGASTSERERAMTLMQLENDLKRDGITLDREGNGVNAEGAVIHRDLRATLEELATSRADAIASAQESEAYNQIVADVTNYIAAKNEEARAVGLSAQAASALRHEMELLNQIAAAGIAITPHMSQEVRQMAEGMAAAEAAAERLRLTQDEVQGALKDAGKGFVSDMVEGKSAVEALTGALDRLASKLMDLALDLAFDALFDGFKIPGLGRAGGVKAATGGLVRGPGSGTSDSIPARLSDGEFVVRSAIVRQPGMARYLSGLNSGALPEFADGGMVGTMPLAAPSLRPAISLSPRIAIENHMLPPGAPDRQAETSMEANGDMRIRNFIRQEVQGETLGKGARTHRGLRQLGLGSGLIAR